MKARSRQSLGLDAHVDVALQPKVEAPPGLPGGVVLAEPTRPS